VTEQDGAAGGVDPRNEGGPTGPVIRDKRKVDPQTGQVRETVAEAQASQQSDAQAESEQRPAHAAADAEAPTTAEGEVGDDTAVLEGGLDHPDTLVAAERLEDLRRLQAEYVNYRRRVDRDRARDKEVAVGGVVEALLPVLDDIHSAREHGDLTEGPFAAIADKLAATLGRFGVEQFGAAGDTFDPALHEALMHLPEADLPEGASETTVVQVMQPGFRVGDRIVRPARVAVADPA
jgi:molecular chaperone GrpE